MRRRRLESSAPRSRAGARSVRRMRWPGHAPSCPGRFAPPPTRTRRSSSCRRRSMRFAGSAPRSMWRPPNVSCATPRIVGAARVSVRKTFMFTDIVGSTNLAEALGDQAWERLLRWHDDMLRKLVASGGGEIVNSTGDGFFVAFDSARSGVDCARSIQRALVDHRDSSGFALSVRIGLHTRRSEPARDGLQRHGGPRRRPGRGARRGRGDPRDRRDPRRGRRRSDLGGASGPGEGRDRTGECRGGHLDLALA